MALQGGAQLILQSQRPDQLFECLGFAGIPIVNPVLIALACADTPEARSDLDILRGELSTSSMPLSPQIGPVPLPCGGTAPIPRLPCSGRTRLSKTPGAYRR